MRGRSVLVGAAVALAALAGAQSCPAAAPPGTAAETAGAATQLVDQRGVRLAFETPPRRIVSMLPSLTETVCALGACASLVGVDDRSNWPAPVRQLPRVGGLDDANVERIVALRPDLVLLARSARIIERLESLGLRVATLEPQSMAGMRQVVEQLGQALDRAPQARALEQRIEAGIVRAADSVPAAARGARVYVEVGSGPYAASESSFIGETLARLGVRNVVPGSLGPFPRLNPEFVVRADPQLIMIGARQAQALETRPGWARIEALRMQRVCTFGAGESDVLVRAGPRMDEAAALMADCLRRHLP